MVYLRIDEILEEKKKSKYWLIKEMEGNYKVITTMIERGSISIRFDTIDKLCSILECTPGDLFERDVQLYGVEGKKQMSKLLKKYEELKKNNADIVYLFKNGIFYIGLNEDANLLSNKIGLKISYLSPKIIKCGFPISAIEKYKKIFTAKNINYEIVSLNSNNSQNYEKIISRIKKLDLERTSVSEIYSFVENIQKELKNF